MDAPPEGEVIWREDGDTVRFTANGWLLYVNRGKTGCYVKRLRATPELVAVLRGESDDSCT